MAEGYSRELEAPVVDVSTTLREGYKAMADTAKQLATLCTASIVILGTYLKDIFGGAQGPQEWELLIPMIFTGFAVSLLLAALVAYFVGLRFITPGYRQSAQNPGGIVKAFYRFQDAEYLASISVFWCCHLSLLSFGAGVTLLAAFATKNLG